MNLIPSYDSDLPTVQQYYEQRAKGYDTEARWNYQDRELVAAHICLLNPRSGDKVLDVATGTGSVGESFSRISEFVVGLDASLAMLRIAKDRLHSVVLASAHYLPFSPSSFDHVICRQGLHYMNPIIALQEMKRVARKYVLISQVICHDVSDSEWWWHVFRILTPLRKHIFTSDGITALMLQIGLRNIQVQYREEINSLGGWLKSKPEAREDVHRIFRDAPSEISQKYGFIRTSDDLLYVHRWALVRGEK